MFDTDQLTPWHRARIQMIEDEDYSGVRRKTKEMYPSLSEAMLDEGIEALKAYYAIALVDPLNEHAVAPEIDLFWHSHILHTKQYADFCQRVFGEFLHHTPLNHTDDVEVREVRDLYDYTVGVYRALGADPENFYFASDLPDHQLVCRHQRVHIDEVRERALFALAT